jgi:hypothetical protein
MATHVEIADRFADQAGRPNPRLLRSRSANVLVSPCDSRNLVSYGAHFVLARIMLDQSGGRSWWLLNGDTYSISTTTHQRIVREACQRTSLPMLIVPFSCLREARIDRDSITLVDIQSERLASITHHSPTRDQVPETHRPEARETPNGRWQWTTYRHWLGAAVFRADYTSADTTRGNGRTATRTAYFLSAFDDQETRPHYFLCELPQGIEPGSVADALHALKPAEVIAAEQAGLSVTRQGDVFAIPATLTTRQLPHKRERRAHLLHLSHTATEVCVTDDGTTYARGVLRHAPVESWRAPEHRRQPMGDRTTWHRIVKNTVPIDTSGQSRAWSRAGNVD